MSAPERMAASATTTASASPAMMRLRAGNWPARGLVPGGFEDDFGAAAKCAGPLLVGHRHLGDIPLDLGVDHSCATDLALAPLLASAIRRGALAIGVRHLCRRGGNRHKRAIRRCRGSGITAERKIELLELVWRQLFGVPPKR